MKKVTVRLGINSVELEVATLKTKLDPSEAWELAATLIKISGEVWESRLWILKEEIEKLKS